MADDASGSLPAKTSAAIAKRLRLLAIHATPVQSTIGERSCKRYAVGEAILLHSS
jgi:hypothetical protein